MIMNRLVRSHSLIEVISECEIVIIVNEMKDRLIDDVIM